MQGLERRLLASRAWAAFSRGVVVPWVAAFARFPAEADVLELGCGNGFEAEAFAERFPGWGLTATDLDPEMVAATTARLARFGDRVRVERADAAVLPYADRSFDVAFAVFVWHHVGIWREATAEAHRVLRGGGRLVLADVRHPLSHEPDSGILTGTYGLDALRRAVAEAGFRRIRLRTGLGPWYRLVAQA